MLQQPRVPPTGQRQAIEIQIKWREVLAQKQAMLKILSQTTGHSPEKLDKVCQAGQHTASRPAVVIHPRVRLHVVIRPDFSVKAAASMQRYRLVL